MTHLTPKEQAAVSAFRFQLSCLETMIQRREQCSLCKLPGSADRAKHLALAADAIEQRAALAGQVVVLTEALEAMPHNSLACMQARCFRNANGDADLNAGHNPVCHWEKRAAALALSLPQAAKQVAEWKRKAELLDWLIKNRDVANLTAINKDGAVEFVLKVKELYGPWSFEECEWDDEQILNALRAAKEGRAAKEASDE